MTTQPVYIVDVIGAVVDKVRSLTVAKIQQNETAALGVTGITTINYQYGHFKELIQTLAQYDLSNSQRFEKYPLIYLVQDFREQRGRQPGVYSEVSLNIVICHQTDANYKITDRMNKVFKPVLYPIYYSLIEQLTKSNLTFASSPDMVQHDKYDRSYWGSDVIDKNMLNDYVDAIDIQNLQLKIDYQPCFQ
jgi:hypothetical protein